MNGITSLNLYPSLNMTAIQSAMSLFNQVVSSNYYVFLPGLQERVVAGSAMMNHHGRALVVEVMKLEVKISNSGIGDIAAQYRELSESNAVTEAVKSKGMESLYFLSKKRLLSVITKAEETRLAVHALKQEFNALSLDHYASELLDYDESRLKILHAREASLQTQREKIVADLQALKAADAVLGTDFWLEQTKSLLPTPEEVELLVSIAIVPKVDAQIIQLALQRLGQYVDLIAEVAKRSSLAQAIMKASGKLTANTRERLDNQEKIQVLQARKERVEAYDCLLEAKAQWVGQVGNVLECVEIFLRECRLFQTAEAVEMRRLYDHFLTFEQMLRQVRV
ncbi:alpha-xenorhabdolysin family binary toxin subunit B [Pseudomonas helleri]|uniref:Alpha-xenorhabdolysin family binary toxin subunit B n=1 Tax=Pseudomonas helleri TaxID=1608996 RepID=A0A7X2CEW6_9PSED|nr:alpha-xenorhabdolysin family binary toxin subunit B [Pseudomonas helleri]MQU28564.1 alpha-xenorhabdolysin family binary toxin subunit B [Pseudomonas helleri]